MVKGFKMGCSECHTGFGLHAEGCSRTVAGNCHHCDDQGWIRTAIDDAEPCPYCLNGKRYRAVEKLNNWALGCRFRLHPPQARETFEGRITEIFNNNFGDISFMFASGMHSGIVPLDHLDFAEHLCQPPCIRPLIKAEA